MDPWVAVGSAIAVLIIVLGCIGPDRWLHPKSWHIPDIGAAFFVFVGANSITEALKIATLFAEGRILISNGKTGGLATYASFGSEDSVFFVAGVAAGAIVGLISIRDGIKKLAGGGSSGGAVAGRHASPRHTASPRSAPSNIEGTDTAHQRDPVDDAEEVLDATP